VRYAEFRDRVQRKLRRKPAGFTWAELRDELDLPYARPCPSWTARLEREIGLTRTKGHGRAFVWKLPIR
jgi:hypothetical protein